MFKWLWKIRVPKPDCYVIVYDRRIGEDDDETVEEYYGYFATPEEAKAVWDMYSEGVRPCENVKLCKVVEDWA
jgi:hypothetical protein